jgi:hypothetical protein
MGLRIEELSAVPARKEWLVGVRIARPVVKGDVYPPVFVVRHGVDDMSQVIPPAHMCRRVSPQPGVRGDLPIARPDYLG